MSCQPLRAHTILLILLVLDTATCLSAFPLTAYSSNALGTQISERSPRKLSPPRSGFFGSRFHFSTAINVDRAQTHNSRGTCRSNTNDIPRPFTVTTSTSRHLASSTTEGLTSTAISEDCPQWDCLQPEYFGSPEAHNAPHLHYHCLA